MSGCASFSQRKSTASRPFTPFTLYVATFIAWAVQLEFRRQLSSPTYPRAFP